MIANQSAGQRSETTLSSSFLHRQWELFHYASYYANASSLK